MRKPQATLWRSPWWWLKFLLLFCLGIPVLLSILLVASLRWVDPPSSAFIEINKSRIGASNIAHQWMPLSAISEHAVLAVLAAEDQRFFEHHGFDFASIKDALAERRSGGRKRGASTITQQVAKNMFLWPARSWVRKGLEAYLTVLIEIFWPKDRILEIYLNVAQFGKRTFGIAAASEAFFGKTAKQISAREAALLAGVLPSPSRMQADAPSDYLRTRASWLQEQMRVLRNMGTLDKL